MKRIVDNLLRSLGELTNTLVFMFFFIIVFSIMGIQTFHGETYQRCRQQKNQRMTQEYGKLIKLKVILFVKLDQMTQIPANQKLTAVVLSISAFSMIPSVKLIHFKIVIITGMIHLSVTILLFLMILVRLLSQYLKQLLLKIGQIK